jgi:hypothetical protein
LAGWQAIVRLFLGICLSFRPESRPASPGSNTSVVNYLIEDQYLLSLKFIIGENFASCQKNRSGVNIFFSFVLLWHTPHYLNSCITFPWAMNKLFAG